jgi:hypothetical protein
LDKVDEEPGNAGLPGLALTLGLAAVAGLIAAAVIGKRRASERTSARSTALEDLRASIGKIASAAQAGTVGDSAAAEYAFALIARRAHDCELLLADPAGSGNRFDSVTVVI